MGKSNSQTGVRMIERYECYLASDHNITFTKENLGNWCKYKHVQRLEEERSYLRSSIDYQCELRMKEREQNQKLVELVEEAQKMIKRARQLTHTQIVTLPIKYQSKSLSGVAQDLGYWEVTLEEKLKQIQQPDGGE